jgi:hypothetical protein
MQRHTWETLITGSLIEPAAAAAVPRDRVTDTTMLCLLAALCRTGQYTLFIQRYADSSRMTPYLMDALLPKIRAGVLQPRTPIRPCAAVHKPHLGPPCASFSHTQLSSWQVGIARPAFALEVVYVQAACDATAWSSFFAMLKPACTFIIASWQSNTVLLLLLLCLLLCPAAGVSAMMTAYHPCRLPLLWVAQQLGFETDEQDEVGGDC